MKCKVVGFFDVSFMFVMSDVLVFFGLEKKLWVFFEDYVGE